MINDSVTGEQIVTVEAVSAGTKINTSLRVLHWLMALAIACAWLFIYSKGLFPKGSAERDFLKSAHMFAGLAVLALLPYRAMARRMRPLPPITPALDYWQTWLAHGFHVLLYAGMFVTPVLGILFVQSAGKEITALGFTFPTLIGHGQGAVA